MFYGWYTNSDNGKKKYRLPLAYFITALVVYAYSFFATLRKMAENSRMSKLSEKDDECIFSWKLFTAWDYMIGNSEAAHNRVASIIMGFKEALLEEAEKKKELRNWKVTAIRIMVNIGILGLFSLSAGTVAFLVRRSINPEGQNTFWKRNELTIVMSLISLIFPMLFDLMGMFEQYHPRKQLRIQLGRIMALNLLNLYSLIISQFDKVYDFSDEMTQYFKNLRSTRSNSSYKNQDSFDRPLDLADENVVYCFQRCYQNISITNTSLLIAALVLNSSIYQTSTPLTNGSNSHPLASLPDLTTVPQSSPYEIENIDYPDYDDYFVSEEISTTTANSDQYYTASDEPSLSVWQYQNQTMKNLDNSTKNDTDSTNSTTELYESNDNDWREKFTDYLSYVLFGLKYIETLNSTETSYTSSLDNLSYETTQYSSPDTYSTSNLSSEDSWISSTNTEKPFQIQSSPDTTTNLFPNVTRKTIEKHTTKDTLEPSSIKPTTTTPFEATKTCTIYQESDSQNTVCEWVCEKEKPMNMTEVGYLIRGMNNSDRKKLRRLCWETMFGQDLVKLTVMDLIMTILSTLTLDFIRAVFVRLMNNCWCWDLEKRFPKYSDFKVAENILHLVNNQGMIWMGLFFSPGLALINVFKLFILMYLRGWTVLTCNVPPEIIFRASKSNNFYYALLLMMLFLCVLPVGYAIVWVEPSWYCGPFSGHKRMYHILIKTITENTPPPIRKGLEYIVSPGSVIPLLVLLILFIYYLTSLANSLREANAELKLQLRRERTEERRKMFQLVDRRRRAGSAGSDPNNPFYKWKKLLSNLPAAKSRDEANRLESFDQSQNSDSVKDGRDFFSRLIKKALHKSSTQNPNPNQDDASDTEQLESLPNDINKPETRNADTFVPTRKTSSSSSRFKNLVSAATADKIKKEIKDVQPTIEQKVDIVSDTESRSKSNEANIQAVNEDNFSTSNDPKRQESVSSNWSDNIPVITISKSASSENILNTVLPQDDTSSPKDSKQSSPSSNETNNTQNQSETSSINKNKPKPKVKYALKKQSTEIDEESICYFNKDVMKQRSQMFVHESCWNQNPDSLTSTEKSGSIEEEIGNTKKNLSLLKDESRVTFDENISDEPLPDSVFK